MRHLYLGPDYAALIPECVAKYRLKERPSRDWKQEVAQAIADGLIVGYYDGRMEACSRAPGARSILADPRRHDMKDILNSRVKAPRAFQTLCAIDSRRRGRRCVRTAPRMPVSRLHDRHNVRQARMERPGSSHNT